MKHGSKFAVAMFALLTIVSPLTRAQSLVTGAVSGLVKDPTGAGVPNTVVSAKSDAYGDTRKATTNAAGEYHIPLLPPGTYVLSVEARGFQPASVPATVSLGQDVSLDIALSLQQQSQTLEVVGDTAPLLQVENANNSVTLSPTQLANIPIAGGDMVAYAYSTAGVNMSTGAGYGNFTAFGLPATSNLFTLNGSDYMDPYLNLNNSGASNLSLGANEIQEAAIITNGYTGQYGRQAGAQVNYVTKSGSNAFHGNALWDWNGSKLNANDFFQNSAGNPRSHEVSNQWATSAGGPIKKNKLFFYWDYEGMRYVLPSGTAIYIPTTAFAAATIANLNATNPSAVPFYNKMFSLYAGAGGAASAVPVTKGLDAQLGCGDLAGTIGAFGVTQPCARQFQSNVNSLNTEWLSAERADYNPTDKDHLYFRAWTDRGVQATGTDGINPAFNANSNQPQWSTQLGYTRVISANSVNELLLSGFYYAALFGPPNINAALAVFPTTTTFGDGLFSNLGGGANASGTGDNNYPSGRKVAQWQIVDDYAYTRGKHELKFGINFRRDDVGDYAYGPNTSGLLTFNSMTDFYNGALANGSTYSQNFTRIGAEHIGLYSMGAYGQDQWRIRPDLTITLGLRFESAENPSCGRNCFARPGSSFTDVQHIVTNPYNTVIQTGLSNAFLNFDKVVAQPRVGLAYTLNKKTVIRGGYGLFADQLEGNLASRFFTNSPNVAAFTATSGIAAPGVTGSAFGLVAASNAAFQNGFASGATLATLKQLVPGFTVPNLYTQATNIHLPRYNEWNVEIQRQIIDPLTLSVNYVGNKGWDEINQNPFLNAYSPVGFGGLPSTAPDARFGEILELSSTGHSNYQGLTSSLKWRFKSLVGSAAYTWSHDLDTCSNNCLGRFNLATSPSFRYDLTPAGASSSYGNADYDIRHTFNANYVWTIPAPFKNSMMKRALGGWVLGGSFMAHTGYPFSVYNSALRSPLVKNSSGIGTVVVLANYLGGGEGSCSSPNTPCLTASEFAKTATQTTPGNSARNSFRGPGYFDTDMSVKKTVAIWERARFTIGMNFFNLFNHPNFDLPVSNTGLGNFGTIIQTASAASSAYGAFEGSAVSGRVIVTHLKFEF